MEQIVVHQKRIVNNVTVNSELPLFSEYPLRSVTSAKMQMQHMANDYVQLTVLSEEKLSLEIGDYIEVRSRRYSIRSVSDITRDGEARFTYTITFYGVMYDLMRYQFRNTGIDLRSSAATFDLTFTLSNFIKCIVYNAHRSGDTSWAFDDENCPATEPKTMSFDKQNCLTCLQNITTGFDVEFLITQENVNGVWTKTIHVGTFGTWKNQSSPFEYGMGNGLYSLQECKVDDSAIINRLWAEGGTDNIVSGYRGYAGRLQLPLLRLSTKQHTFANGTVIPAGVWIGIEDDANRYLDEEILDDLSHRVGQTPHINPYNSTHLIDRYGILEDSTVFDDIFPSKTFTVTSIPTTNPRQTFKCNVNFDLNAHWLMPSPHVGDPTYSANAYADFYEWCYIRYGIEITAAQYEACYDYWHDERDYHDSHEDEPTGWDHFSLDHATYQISQDEALAQYELDNPSYHYTVPSSAWNQSVYEKFEIYAQSVLNNDTKYLADGAKVVFITGKLAGIEFDIINVAYHSLTHTSTITIDLYTDETETVFPSEDADGAFRFAPNDTFKLTGIYMPKSYYDEAEEDLWFAAYEKFEDVKFASYIYKLTFDKFFVDENKTFLATIKPGDYISITDSRFGLNNAKMRVSAVDIELLNELDFSLTLESIHKLRTRYGYSISRHINDLEILTRSSGLDDPLIRKAGRITGRNAVSRIMTGNNAIRADRVADAFIVERMIGNSAVTTSKINGSAVTADKIATKAVTAAKIDDGAVSATKLDSGVVQTINGKAAQTDVESLYQIVGKEENQGLRNDTKNLKDTVGDANSGLVKDVANATQTASNAKSTAEAVQSVVGADANSGLRKNVSDLQSTIGDSNSGLVKDVASLGTTIGDASSGLVQKVNNIIAKYNTMASTLNSKHVADCDGQTCIRFNFDTIN